MRARAVKMSEIAANNNMSLVAKDYLKTFGELAEEHPALQELDFKSSNVDEALALVGFKFVEDQFNEVDRNNETFEQYKDYLVKKI